MLRMEWIRWKRGLEEPTVIEVAAVHPDGQGKGVGSRLLADYLNKRDTAHALMSSNPRNVKFYQRSSYEIVDTCPIQGTHFTWMHRPKRANAQ